MRFNAFPFCASQFADRLTKRATRGFLRAFFTLILAFPLVLPSAGSRPAQAFELFGVQLFESAQDEEDLSIDRPFEAITYSVDFQVTGAGSPGLDGDDVRSASVLWRQADERATSSARLITDAKDDYRRLLGTLYSAGYYGGVISILINGDEADSLSASDDVSTPANIAISVDPGPQFRFGTASVVNPAPAFQSAQNERDFAPGLPALSGAVRRAEQSALNAWREQGYALASVDERRVDARHSENLLDARITINPGPLVTYGVITVEGAERMDPAFIISMANLSPGGLYHPDAIEAANDRLANLGVFRSVRVEVSENAAPDGAVPVTIFVQERPLRRIGAGGSFSSVDGFGFETYWLHRNLFGQAERFRVEARVADMADFDPEAFTYRFGMAFTKPGFLTPNTELFAALDAQREVLVAYTRTGASGQVGLSHPFSPQISGRLGVFGRHAQFEDDIFGTRDFTSAGFEGRLTYDTRDVPSNPAEGLYAELTATPYYEFSRGNPGAQLTAEGRAFVGLGQEDRIVLAARLRIGSLIGPSIAQTAPDRLFFAGGGGSVRGYAFRNIGVEMPGNQITGGRSLVEGSAEIRAQITDTLGLVAFADFGAVSADSLPTFDDSIKVGVGAGLRYLTPFGPLRLDAAVPLDPGPGDPDFAVYIGIGQAF